MANQLVKSLATIVLYSALHANAQDSGGSQSRFESDRLLTFEALNCDGKKFYTRSDDPILENKETGFRSVILYTSTNPNARPIGYALLDKGSCTFRPIPYRLTPV